MSGSEAPRVPLNVSSHWKGFRFCPKYDEYYNQVGWEVTCCNVGHGRCVRTLNFRKHKGQLNVEKMLKFWCLAAADIDTKANHSKLPFPDPLPSLDVLDSGVSVRSSLVALGAQGLCSDDQRKRRRVQ